MDLHPFRQRTFKQRARLSGIGLHTGASVRVTLAPAPVDSGIVFVANGVKSRSLGIRGRYDHEHFPGAGVRPRRHRRALLAGSRLRHRQRLIEVEGPKSPSPTAVEPFVALVREPASRAARDAQVPDGAQRA